MDGPGLRYHYLHLVGGEDRIVEAPDDEDDSLALRILDSQQLVLQMLAGLGAQGGEGLVHQQQLRRLNKDRAIATRWRMPPESSWGQRALPLPHLSLAVLDIPAPSLAARGT